MLTGIEQAFIGLICVCLILTSSLCAYLFRYRANQIWQAAGVGFYMLMGCGCMIAYLAVLSWPVENDATSCGFRIWVWTAGFHAFVAPMVACAFRIARIYTQGLQSVRVSNQQVAGYCVMLYTPQLLLNILWTSISPIQPTIVEVDPLRPKFDYTICSNEHPYGNVLFGTLTLIYSGVLLLSACYLAWRVRQAYSIFNDAKPIAPVDVYLLDVRCYHPGGATLPRHSGPVFSEGAVWSAQRWCSHRVPVELSHPVPEKNSRSDRYGTDWWRHANRGGSVNHGHTNMRCVLLLLLLSGVQLSLMLTSPTCLIRPFSLRHRFELQQRQSAPEVRDQ